MQGLFICGVAGSGKSSLASCLSGAMETELLDADQFHPEANLAKMRSGRPLAEADREPWLAAMEAALLARDDSEFVMAVPGLKRSHRARLMAAAPGARLLFLSVSPATARARVAARGGFFPPDLVSSQFEALEPDPQLTTLDAECDLDTLTQRALAVLSPGSAGVVGLGRMGLGLAGRLMDAGFEVHAFDLRPSQAAQAAGLVLRPGLQELGAGLPAPRRLLLSLPAGAATREAVLGLLPGLASGDLLIDASNGHYRQSQELAEACSTRCVRYVDAGVSGGVYGARQGYCVMAGASTEAYEAAYPLLRAVAAPGALLRCGDVGTGHFVKMVHNGIEYGQMQAIAEGMALLKAAPGEALPLAEIAALWNRGAVVRSWLMELSAEALSEDRELSKFDGKVGENGTGRWAAETGAELKVPTPALDAALAARAASRETPGFASKLLSALRAKFGGHGEAK